MTLHSAATYELRGAPAHPEWTFTGQCTCPVCETRFEQLKIRDSAVQPQSRESDFHVVYRGADPSLYAITVCPECSYAALHDDWDEISLQETAALRAARGDRQAGGAPNLCGDRTHDDLATAIDLTIACYAQRQGGDRRIPGLLHRRAWLERARGDREAEAHWLGEACEAYRGAYQRSDITDHEALRVSYLVGDLLLRLDDIDSASEWLTAAVGMLDDLEARGDSEVPTALARLARDRLGDARAAVRKGA